MSSSLYFTDSFASISFSVIVLISENGVSRTIVTNHLMSQGIFTPRFISMGTGGQIPNLGTDDQTRQTDTLTLLTDRHTENLR